MQGKALRRNTSEAERPERRLPIQSGEGGNLVVARASVTREK